MNTDLLKKSCMLKDMTEKNIFSSSIILLKYLNIWWDEQICEISHISWPSNMLLDIPLQAMYGRFFFFYIYIFPPNTFLYTLISTHLDYCWLWSPMKTLSITFGTLTKKVTIVENENNKLYLIVSEFNVNKALWINSTMPLIFMPDNTRLSCGIKQILEPDVTCDTKQCLFGLLLPAAKN